MLILLFVPILDLFNYKLLSFFKLNSNLLHFWSWDKCCVFISPTFSLYFFF